jgi:energy-coupling factor transporter ATP-binding protein EcfA2
MKKEFNMKELFLLRGLPGAGKSTLAESLGNMTIEADQYFTYNGKYEFDASKLKLSSGPYKFAGSNIVESNPYCSLYAQLCMIKFFLANE